MNSLRFHSSPRGISAVAACILASMGMAACGSSGSGSSSTAGTHPLTAAQCGSVILDSGNIETDLIHQPVDVNKLAAAFKQLGTDTKSIGSANTQSLSALATLDDAGAKLANDIASNSSTTDQADANRFVAAVNGLGKICPSVSPTTTASASASSTSPPSALAINLTNLGATQAQWESAHGQLSGPTGLVEGVGLQSDGPEVTTSAGQTSQQFQNVTVESGRVTEFGIKFAAGTTEQQAQAFVSSMLPKDSSTINSLTPSTCTIQVVHSPSISAVLGGDSWKEVHGWATAYLYTGSMTSQKPFDPNEVDEADLLLGDASATGC